MQGSQEKRRSPYWWEIDRGKQVHAEPGTINQEGGKSVISIRFYYIMILEAWGIFKKFL